MTPLAVALLVPAGIGAGLVGTVAGMASLISYPALIAAGLGPVAANVTNTVALLGNAVGGIRGSLPELAGQRQRVRRLVVPAVLGGATGGGLLLVTPAAAFSKIVPWLIALAAVAVLIGPRPAGVTRRTHRNDRLLRWGIFGVSVYGGYFGAASGVLMLAAILHLTGENLVRASALRTTVLAAANGVAALAFILLGPVHWAAAIALGAGFLVGSRLGPVVLRRTPERPLRLLIAVVGMGLALRLGLQAYR